MKRSLIWILLLCPCRVSAQLKEPIVGIRQGASLWLTRTGVGQGTLKYAAGQHFTWDKEAFLRARLQGKWAYDLSLSYYRFKNTGENRRRQAYTERNDIVATNVSLQYDVTYPLLGYMFYSMQKMQAYIGFELAPSISFNQQVRQDAPGVKTEFHNTTFAVMLGFSYTHIIPVTNRLHVTSRLAFHTNSFSKYPSFSGELKPNKRVGLVTGIGYRL